MRKEIVIQTLKAHNPKSIIEVGCGIDPLCLYFHDYFSPVYCWTECPILRKISTQIHDSRITIINKELENRKFLPENVDFIVMSSLLHEINNPDELLSSLKNM